MKRRPLIFALAALVVLPLFAAAPAGIAKPGKPAKPLHIAKGTEVKLADYLVPGKTVIFDFYSDYCGPCVQMSPMLEKLHATRADVVVVKVDINRPGVNGIDWKSPTAAQFKLNSIPHFKVYGPDGKLKAEDSTPASAARRLVMGMMN